MPRPTSPNILLVTTDTQRCDTLRCMGNAHAVSPHLDRLAAEGVLYEQAHTSSPVCSPARCTLLTGVHAPVHGAVENGIRRHEHLTLFPDLLQQAGYTNLMIGKTHFGPAPGSFDVCIPAHGAHGGDTSESQHREARIVDAAIAALDDAAAHGTRPFFAFCSLISPHPPFEPPGRWAHLYDDRPLPQVNHHPGEEVTHPDHLRTLLRLLEGNELTTAYQQGQLDPAAVDAQRRLYYGLAAYCDEQVGRLLDHLDRTGLSDNTLVIFTSDHGTTLFDHGFVNKHNYYDESWRVPLILRFPGRLPAGERRGFASWVDLAPTILGAAGLHCDTLQGFDLLASPPRHCAGATLYRSFAVAARRWKLEYYPAEARGRLFDRQADPAEQTDLWGSPTHRAVRDALSQALLTWRADMTDVQQLRERTTEDGGPIARYVGASTRGWHGRETERQLNEAVARIEG